MFGFIYTVLYNYTDTIVDDYNNTMKTPFYLSFD